MIKGPKNKNNEIKMKQQQIYNEEEDVKIDKLLTNLSGMGVKKNTGN